MTITPVLLCGGSGARLWPLSRKSYPKQFVPLMGEETLFQASAKRLSGPVAEGEGALSFAAPMVLTNSDFRFIITEQLQAVGIDPGAILIEPEGRNTAPAVLAAALRAAAQDPEAILLVAPSDHVVPDVAAFHAAIERGLAAVKAGQLVTFGIAPSHAETAYGYLELAETPDDSGNPVPLKRFVEKTRCHPRGRNAGGRQFQMERGHLPLCRKRHSCRLPDPCARADCAGAGRIGRGRGGSGVPASGAGALGRGRGYLDRLCGDGEGREPFGGAF